MNNEDLKKCILWEIKNYPILSDFSGPYGFIGARTYLHKVDSDTQYPFAVYYALGERRNNVAKINYALFQIDVLARLAIDANEIIELLILLFENKCGTFGDPENGFSVEFVSVNVLPDDYFDEPQAYRRSIELRITYKV
jgi:hypothetical protein